MLELPDPLQWVVEHDVEIRHLLRKMCRGDRQAQEDMYSEVVLERVHAVFATYDPTKGANISTHAKKNLGWYMWKYMNRLQRARGRHQPQAQHGAYASDHEDVAQVELLRAHADPADMRIVEMHDLMGYTFSEIGEEYGVLRGAARTMYRAAMQRIRDAIVARPPEALPVPPEDLEE